ncbi:hypothetical protein D3C85_1637690 [compost metagenome]
MQDQAVGGSQQHFKEHEQVEQVGGEKRAIQAHQLDLEQGVEAGAGAVPTGHGEHQGADPDDAGQHQHQG